MIDGETVLLIGIGGFLLGRAIWLSVVRRRHLAWIAALSGPVGLLGIVLDQVWPFVIAVGLLVVGEFLYQTNDVVGPSRLRRLRGDVQVGRRRESRKCSGRRRIGGG